MESLKSASLALITDEIPRVWLNSFKRKYSSRLQKWFTNCKLLMCWENLPKLWCRIRTLVLKKTQIRHDLPPLPSRILCSSLLFVDDLFSVRFQERLCISFSRRSTLDIRLFTYVFSCSLLRSSRRILPILGSSLTFFRVLLDSLYVFYLFFFLVA